MKRFSITLGMFAGLFAWAETPKANLDFFRKEIEPGLKAACVGCHGPKKQKAKFRVDTLDPDLLQGKDVSWWLEVQGVLTNGEMPPPDSEVKLADADRVKVIDWLAREIRAASEARRAEGGHSTFRRMTRYEYKYAMQDLLGLPHDFSRDLPPETSSEDGFKNSSDMLQMTAVQFAQYRAQARRALELPTAHLYLTMLHKLGVEAKSFAGSTETLSEV